MLQSQPRLRRWIVIGTPLLTFILLLFHPRPNPAALGITEPLTGMDMYHLMASVADPFLALHALFAPALALLGLTVVLLLDGVRGVAAASSRISAFVFAVTYILYETMVGTASALLVRGAATLPPDEQAAIGEAVLRIWGDPIFGDLPSIVSSAAWLSWVLAVSLAALALRRAGRTLAPCILLGLSFMFISHASPLGLAGLLSLLAAAATLERAGAPTAARRQVEARAG
jgi:hypothetical protein